MITTARDVKPGQHVRYNIAEHRYAPADYVWLYCLANIPHEDGVVTLLLADNAVADGQPFCLPGTQEMTVR